MKNYSVNGDVLRLNLIKLNQPIGDLFVGAIQSDILLKYSTVNRRIEEDFELSGLQREIKSSKLKELNNYLSWSGATFPFLDRGTVSRIRNDDGLAQMLGGFTGIVADVSFHLVQPEIGRAHV